MNLFSTYIPMDRRQALAQGIDLPERTVGTALFADISGFTPLTQTLAEELGPKRGAEEVLRHINPVYEALITELHRYQGAVLGFAGDSITCWFDENIPEADLTEFSNPVGSAQRALACALAMQAAIQAFTTVTTAAGTPLTIAVKIALAVGPARRFVVGNPTIQCIDTLVGATLDEVAVVERWTEKGEVVASAGLVEIIGKSAVAITTWREDEENGRFYAVIAALLKPVQPDPWPQLETDPLSQETIKSWLLPPVYERLQGIGGFLAELRPAVALFLKFSGLDYDHDPQVGDKLDAYICWVQSALARYEGYLLQLTIGDKGSYLYAAFGAPLAHDDDALRAVAAALDLQNPPATLDFIQQTQIGLSQGRMWSGACGAKARRTYGVMGAETNMAARLMSRATPGQILVSQRLASAISSNYSLNYLGLVPIKGLTQLMAISEVLGRQTTLSSHSSSRYTAPLVDRDDILLEMDEIAKMAVAGQGQIIRVKGATGVGKSHLLTVFSDRAREQGWRTAIGHCLSINQSVAYMPWQQIFYDLFDMTQEVATNPPPQQLAARVEALIRATNPDWLVRLPLLGDLLGLPIADNPTTAAFDASLRQKSLFALAVAILQTWAQRQPLLLVLEDIHWMDDASLALTTAVGRASAQEPLLLALAQRPVARTGVSLLPELSQLSNHHRLNLHELSPSGVAAMTTNRLHGDVTTIALSLITARTAGNPFFVEELVDSLRESGSLRQEAGESGRWSLSDQAFDALNRAGCLVKKGTEWDLAPNAPLATVDLGVPDSIQGIVLSRIDRLPESHKLLLKVASVIGQRFYLKLLGLSHPPVQPLPMVIARQSEEIEARDFLRLEQKGESVETAVYVFRHNTTQEVAYDMLLFEQRRQLHQAVGKAIEQTQPDNVSALAYHAFVGEDWPNALRYHLLAGRQKQRFALYEAIEHYKKARHCCQQLPVANTAKQRLEIQLSLGELYVTTGQYEAAQENLTLALETADNNNARARACRWLARLHELRGEYPAALDWIQKGLYTPGAANTSEGAEMMLISGLINTRQGDYENAAALTEIARQIGEQLDNVNVVARAHNLTGIIARLRGNRTEAIEQFQQAFSLYQQVNNVHGQALAQNQIATAWFDISDWAQADQFYRAARAIFVQLGDAYNQMAVDNNLGGIALNQGRLDEALTYYRAALRSQEQTGGSLWVLGVLNMNLGHTFMRHGKIEQAQAHLNTSKRYFNEAQARDFLPEMHRLFAGVALLANNLSAAKAEARQSFDIAVEMGSRGEEGLALRIKGEIALWDDQAELAEAHLVNSLTILDEVGDKYEAARTALALAKLYAAQGNEERKQAALTRCIAVFEELEAALDLQEARTLL